MSHRAVHAAGFGCAASAVLLLATVAVATADPVAEFYKGKTINLIIASGEGGGYDISGRLTAEYLSKYIPGHPTIIARNMPGASGMRAADYMYNVAAQDGTVISVPQPTLLLNKVVDPAARYEPHRFNWIGRLGALQTLGVVWHTAPALSVEDANRTELAMAAAQGPGTGSNVVMALNRLVGTKFKLVKGYKSGAEFEPRYGTGRGPWHQLYVFGGSRKQGLDQRRHRQGHLRDRNDETPQSSAGARAA